MFESANYSPLISAYRKHTHLAKKEGHTVPRRPTLHSLTSRSSAERIANVQDVGGVDGEVVEFLKIGDFVDTAQRTEVEFYFFGDDVCAVEADGAGEGWEEEE